MWLYAADGYRLIDTHLTAKKVRKIRRQFLLGPIIYAIASAIALILPWLAVLFFILLNLFYLWPRWGHKTPSYRVDAPIVRGSRSEDDWQQRDRLMADTISFASMEKNNDNMQTWK